MPMVGNSRARPPAWATPRLTGSTSSFSPISQLLNSLDGLQMPMMGFPAANCGSKPSVAKALRCRTPYFIMPLEPLVTAELNATHDLS